ncbi:SH3 domain-containing protein C23A1.17 isoform X2 [Zootermopsis nevadensis]|uniref:SH3 domain-containing protein C23A1.17 isoform X2 n=1 Tax=Zootermopsis nevadensis TaxID=136037 RepID=UPI000B8EC499|nr:SH3 domain-containing protein C23A1.17 isoform X2 [Zootermopsis nevadensis]
MEDKIPPAIMHLPPPVPLKTYRWEDLRRARVRGGYPWTHLDKPPLDSDAWKNISDHEYEPVGAPPPKVQEPHVTDEMGLGMDEEFDAIKPATKSETSSTSSRERRFLRIPLDDELVVVPGDGEDEDEAMEGENGEAKGATAEEAEEKLSAQEFQSQLEDRYFSATPTTTESRTDYDVNTSQLDSSGLEDIPLKREARKKKQQDATPEKQPETRGFQQRLRSQAGRIRTKLRSIPRPNIKLPERPKLNLPERPKIRLPERPKFNLPERPKFHLPERPKFNLPERPKFSMPERPKFNLPQMPSFSMSKERKARSHHTSSTRRPLRERSQISSASTTSSTKKNIFDFDFKSYPRIFDRKSRRADYATSSPKPSRGQTPPPPQTPIRKKGSWLQRFTDLKHAHEPNPPTAGEAHSRVRDDLEGEEFRDDINVAECAEGSESTTAFRDKDYGYAVTIDDTEQPTETAEQIRASSSSVPDSDREARSSGSSSLRHRAGVLEEIDSDEFFLREKGLSQEDVEVGRYLTSEIREAFRAPVSALSQMDNFEYYDDDEDVENLGQQYRSTPERGPIRPARTRSLGTRKRSSKSREPSPAEEEASSQFFNTFPPARPKRSSRLHQQRAEGIEEQDVSKEIKEQVYEQEMEVEEKDKQIISPRNDILSLTVTDEDDKFLCQSTELEEYLASPSEDHWQTEENAFVEVQPPMPPKRMRRSRKEPIPDTLCNGNYTKEDWLENLEADVIPNEEVMVMRMEPDYIIPAAPPEDLELPPEPPRRGRRKSSRATSLVDEDRTSRGASSLPSEREHIADDLPRDLSLPEIPGYAAVDKPITKPRHSKAQRPSVPGRRKKSNGHQHTHPHFYSLPHRPPPIRPLRNYSTLGPSRPPRKHKTLLPEDIEQKSESYIEIEDDILEPLSHGSARDLQSGDIIERMKGRPLPPPPRPPRKGRESRESREMPEESTTGGQLPMYQNEEETEDGITESEEPFDVSKVETLGALSDDIFYAHPGVTSYDDEKLEEDIARETKKLSNFELEKDKTEPSLILQEAKIRETSPISLEISVEEVSVAIQTDPLPDDICVVMGDEDVPVSHMTVGTETTGQLPLSGKTSKFGQQTTPEHPPPPTVIEKPIPYYVMPDPDTEIELKAQKLQISELEVERLNVGELQAQKILVSDIDGVSLQVAELTSKSGNLVVTGLELPPRFLQDLYDSLPIPPSPSQPVPAPVQVSAPSIPHPLIIHPHSDPPATQLPAPTPPSESPSAQIPLYQAPTLPSLLPQTPSTLIPFSQDPSILTSQSEASPTQTALPQVPPAKTPMSQVSSTLTPQSQTPSDLTTPQYQVPSAQILPSQVPSESVSLSQLSSQVASVPATPQVTSITTSPPQSQQVPTIPSQQTIPLQSIINPNLVTSFNGLHSYIPDYIPPQVPVSLRIPSRTRSHIQRELESEEEMISLMHTPSSRRRRHHPSKPVSRYSSDEEEEEEYSSYRPPSRRHHSSSRGAEPSVGELSRQLVHACQGVTMRALHQLVQYVTPQVREGEDKRRDLQIALCILLVLVAGLILMGFGSGKTYHHHHWDYHFPPPHP